MARSNRDRCHQIHQWLEREYPPIYPVQLRYESAKIIDRTNPKRPIQLDAVVQPWKNGLLLRVWAGLKRGWMTEALLHEYAHVLVWPIHIATDFRPEHPPEWGEQYARLYTGYTDRWGFIRSTRDGSLW